MNYPDLTKAEKEIYKAGYRKSAQHEREWSKTLKRDIYIEGFIDGYDQGVDDGR